MADLKALEAAQVRVGYRAIIDGRLVFDRQAEGRTKTGRAAIGTLSKQTERLVSAYLIEPRTTLLPDAVLFRNRSGAAYSRCEDRLKWREGRRDMARQQVVQ